MSKGRQKKQNRPEVGAVLLLFLVWVFAGLLGNLSRNHTIIYQNSEYFERDNVVNILCIGSDERDTIENSLGLAGYTGQADFVCLISVDKTSGDVRMLSIPRDTLVDVEEYNEDGTFRRVAREQICLQYAYGKSSEEGCRLMAKRVSELLGGTTIDYFFACSLGAVAGVIDDLGGIDVTLSQDQMVLDQIYHKGETVHLAGEDATVFIHFRDITHYYTNLDRMSRQKDFLQALVPRVKQIIKENPRFLFTLLDKYEPYVTHNIPMIQFIPLGWAALTYHYEDGTIVQLPGEDVHVGEYDCFIPQEDQVMELLLKWFYRIED